MLSFTVWRQAGPAAGTADTAADPLVGDATGGGAAPAGGLLSGSRTRVIGSAEVSFRTRTRSSQPFLDPPEVSVSAPAEDTLGALQTGRLRGPRPSQGCRWDEERACSVRRFLRSFELKHAVVRVLERGLAAPT